MRHRQSFGVWAFLPADNHHVACKGAVADAEGDSTVMLSVRGTVGGREVRLIPMLLISFVDDPLQTVHSVILPRLEET